MNLPAGNGVFSHLALLVLQSPCFSFREREREKESERATEGARGRVGVRGGETFDVPLLRHTIFKMTLKTTRKLLAIKKEIKELKEKLSIQT